MMPSPCSETESDALCTPFVWWRSEGGPKVKAALAELAGDLSHLSEDKEKVMKLSPEKIQPKQL
jgi:hypothetical protein